jgi:DNA-binding NtrC family response regulator
MPGINGVEVANEIRRIAPHVPVILTSGYSNNLAAGERPDFELLHKPYSVNDLTRVLTAALHRRPGSSG